MKQEIIIGDSPNLDAFSRMRTSNPVNLWSTSCQYTPAWVQMESWATGTGSNGYNTNTRMASLTTTAWTGTAYMQSWAYIPYQPWKSQLIKNTYVIWAPVQNTVVDVWYFDLLNGLFFRQDGVKWLAMVLRSSTSWSTVDTVVYQDAWNLDKLDWSWPSWISIDITKCQIQVIDLQFLGMGRVRVGMNLDWNMIYAHEFLNANNLTVPYMQSATLPIQILVTATNSNATKTVYFKCSAVDSEWGFEEERGFSFTTPRTITTAGNETRTHLLSLRPKLTYNGIVNRERLVPWPLELYNAGNSSIFWEIVIWAQFSVAPTWADVNTSWSAFEYSSGGTFSWLGTGAIVVASGFCLASNQLKEVISAEITAKYPITLDRAGNQRANGTLTVLVTWIAGTATIHGSMNYKEIR